MTELAANTTALVTMIGSLIEGVVTIFPLNILICAALGSVAFRMFSKGKKAVTK